MVNVRDQHAAARARATGVAHTPTRRRGQVNVSALPWLRICSASPAPIVRHSATVIGSWLTGRSSSAATSGRRRPRRTHHHTAPQTAVRDMTGSALRRRQARPACAPRFSPRWPTTAALPRRWTSPGPSASCSRSSRRGRCTNKRLAPARTPDDVLPSPGEHGTPGRRRPGPRRGAGAADRVPQAQQRCPRATASSSESAAPARHDGSQQGRRPRG
jgi:hypothetical protein